MLRSPQVHLIVHRYRHGLGVSQSVSEAVRLYKLAAAESLPCAQFNLGFMYQRGLGVAQDMTEAIRLYRLAAAQGDDDARCSLAHANEYVRFVSTYSASLPLYVATAHVVAINRLRQLIPPRESSSALEMKLRREGCAQSFAALIRIEVTQAARLRVCSSGWALSLSLRLVRGNQHVQEKIVTLSHKAATSCLARHVVRDVARLICARLLGRRSIIVKVPILSAAMLRNRVVD